MKGYLLLLLYKRILQVLNMFREIYPKIEFVDIEYWKIKNNSYNKYYKNTKLKTTY